MPGAWGFDPAPYAEENEVLLAAARTKFLHINFFRAFWFDGILLRAQQLTKSCSGVR